MPLDLTRSLLVVLIPGAVAMAPWLLSLVLYTDATLGYAEKYNALANAFVFAVAAVAGLVCETIASWIEVAWDKEREAEFEIMENWYSYLARSVDPEPVGYRYLSRLATMFYFELSMLVATVPFAVGAAVLVWFRFAEDKYLLEAFLVVLALIVVCYFRKNARTTHLVLCRTRRELNKRLDGQVASARAGRPSPNPLEKG
ncbi:MAG: hypothetical protein KIS62_15075 [Ramlibacter sp.]|nr:hypothetical protein [Ramlibacter sp.]